MEVLKNYERKVLSLLVSNVLPLEQLNEVIQNAEFISYEYTGSGYYLEIHHSYLPKDRIVCSEPALMGEADGIVCGFVVFIENSELTIECHSWGEINVPEEYRNRDVQVRLFQ